MRWRWKDERCSTTDRTDDRQDVSLGVCLCVLVSCGVHKEPAIRFQCFPHSWAIVPPLWVLLTAKITLLPRPWDPCCVTPAIPLTQAPPHSQADGNHRHDTDVRACVCDGQGGLMGMKESCLPLYNPARALVTRQHEVKHIILTWHRWRNQIKPIHCWPVSGERSLEGKSTVFSQARTNLTGQLDCWGFGSEDLFRVQFGLFFF